MKRDEKHKKAEELHQQLEKARTVILSKFEGLTVAADTELRRKVADAGARYEVVKNRLIERAAAGTGAEPVAQKLEGTTSVAYTTADPVALAKALADYAKVNPALVFKAGVVEGRVVSLEKFNEIAALPSRERLFAMALFLMKASGQQLASVAAGVGRKLAVVIQQGVKENKFQATAVNK
jgi:large subunit ribosomal protein L10